MRRSSVMVSTSPGRTAWEAWSILLRLTRTLPACASLAARERDLTTRAKNSHLSMRWRSSEGTASVLFAQLVPEGSQLGEGRIGVHLRRPVIAPRPGIWLALTAFRSRLPLRAILVAVPLAEFTRCMPVGPALPFARAPPLEAGWTPDEHRLGRLFNCGRLCGFAAARLCLHRLGGLWLVSSGGLGRVKASGKAVRLRRFLGSGFVRLLARCFGGGHGCWLRGRGLCFCSSFSGRLLCVTRCSRGVAGGFGCGLGGRLRSGSGLPCRRLFLD